MYFGWKYFKMCSLHCNIPTQYTQIIYPRNIPKQYTHATYPRNIPKQYTHAIYPCNIPTQYTHAMYPRNIPTQYTHAMYTRNVPTQHTHAIYPRNVPMQYTHAIYPRNVPTQYTHAMYPRNIPTQYTHAMYPRKPHTIPSLFIVTQKLMPFHRTLLIYLPLLIWFDVFLSSQVSFEIFACSGTYVSTTHTKITFFIYRSSLFRFIMNSEHNLNLFLP